MTVTELLEEVRARFEDASFVELHLEDGRLVVYGYDYDLVCTQMKDYEHFSDIRMIEEPKDYVVDDEEG